MDVFGTIILWAVSPLSHNLGLYVGAFSFCFLCQFTCVLSCFNWVQLFSIPWAVACQAPLSKRFSRQEYWSGLSFPSPGDLLDPGIKPTHPALAGGFFTNRANWKTLVPNWGEAWDDPLDEGMAPHSSILDWEIPWAEEPGGLKALGSHDSDTTESPSQRGTQVTKEVQMRCTCAEVGFTVNPPQKQRSCMWFSSWLGWETDNWKSVDGKYGWSLGSDLLCWVLVLG